MSDYDQSQMSTQANQDHQLLMNRRDLAEVKIAKIAEDFILSTQARQRANDLVLHEQKQAVQSILQGQRQAIERMFARQQRALGAITKECKTTMDRIYESQQQANERMAQSSQRFARFAIETINEISKLGRDQPHEGDYCFKCQGKTFLVHLDDCDHMTCLACIGTLRRLQARNSVTNCPTCRLNYHFLMQDSVATMNRQARGVHQSEIIDLSCPENKIKLDTMKERIRKAQDLLVRDQRN